MTNPTNLQCPILHDLFEDPVSLPCCGRAVSRTPLIVALNIDPRCPICRGDVGAFDPVTAPTSRDLAYLVEEARNSSLPPPTPQSEPTGQWKATLTLLKDEYSMFQKKIGRLEFSNDKVLFKTLLIPVIDRSGSMGGAPMTQVRYSLKRLLDLSYANPNIATTVVTYDDREESHHIDTSMPRSCFDGIFNRLDARGGTSFTVAFKELVRVATTYANTKDVASMTILFLTDGEDSSVRKEQRNRLVTALEADIKRIWKKDFVIHSIGFGTNHDYDFLNSLRLIGTEEGAYRYADPSENDDILSNKINSILDVIAQSSSLPLKIISSDFQIVSGANGKFWVRPPSNWTETDPVNVTFSITDGEPIMITAEVKESTELWPAWCSKLIDDIAAELLTLATISEPSTELVVRSEASSVLERDLHIELLARRSNAILSRLEVSSANYHRLTSLLTTIESLRKGEQVNKQKLNDMKFEGQFATKGGSTTGGTSSSKSAGVDIFPIVVPPINKQVVWSILEDMKTRRCKADSDPMSTFSILTRSNTHTALNWIDSDEENIRSKSQNGSNCLHVVTSIGRVPLAKAIISKGIININETNEKNRTPLDLAVVYGYWKMFDLIYENGGQLSIDGQLLLRTCISKGYNELAGRLLRHSLAVITDEMLDNVPTAEGLEWLSAHSTKDLSIEMAILKGALDIVRTKISSVTKVSFNGLIDVFTKSTNNYTSIIDELLKSGKADPDEILTIPDDITFPLFVASEKGCLPMVKVLLPYLSKDQINRQNNKGTTCLWIASCNRHIDVVHELILHGANPNIPNTKGDSALIICCQKGSESMVQLLLEAGISPKLYNPERDNPVLICCRVGHSRILEMLLKKMFTDDPSTDILTHYALIDGFPPLLAATELNRVECIRVCASFGADLEWTTKEDNSIIPGATALHLACYYGRLEATRTLCELGANIAAQTKVGGYTPIHIAVRSGHTAIVRYLLSRNKDILTIPDNDGRLPEYYASMQGREDIKDEFFTDRLGVLFERVLLDPSPEVSNVLVKYGQSLGCYDYSEFHRTNMGHGNTLLSLALIYGNAPLIHALESIDYTLDPFIIKDDYGVTPDFWRSYLFGVTPKSEETERQIVTVQSVAKKNLHNKILTDLSGPMSRPQLTGSQVKPLEFRKKMSEGFNVKTHKSVLVKIRNAAEPPILGFLDKLRNNKVFPKSTQSIPVGGSVSLLPEGKGCLEQILWESKVHIVKLLASGETALSPIHMMALYLYTGNGPVFTQVNLSLSNYNERSLWSPFIICLYQSISRLPPLIGEVYRGVDCVFDPDMHKIGTKMVWSTFAVASKDWRSSSELIKEQKGIIFIIKSKTGKDVSRYSRSPVDSEVLFLPGTMFTITALYRADVIALGQANIRGTTFTARDNDIKKAAEGKTSIIVELEETA